MKFTLHELPKAKVDKRHIFERLLARSPRGAAAWLNAYDQMIARLAMTADTMPIAEESDHVDLEVRQILFKTKRAASTARPRKRHLHAPRSRSRPGTD